MSDTSEIPQPPSPPAASEPIVQVETHSQTFSDVAQDVIMWRKRCLSILVLSAATATWVALQVYQFTFLTVASWVAMFVVASLFVWGNIHRLLGKEVPELSGMEISEGSAVEMAHGIRESVEEGLRWMFRVSSTTNGRELLKFAAILASAWLLSWIGGRFDLLTIAYTGIMVGMTVPLVYTKYEHKFNEYGRRLRVFSQKNSAMIEEKFRMLWSRVTAGKKKEKKME
ncbi:OLC1v1010078C1 [Oldenlandia corymbosa var. corymbosa]|uniref:Reticulon-like protein n=1 Tax=Oldenlandia corymbosa var. corymbosa TaxID=529605 RepID=A0AAV1DT50_OLDCO|nr:OLC1v1010078C1 [Oldenlandia corymbosa var. corymbosa]